MKVIMISGKSGHGKDTFAQLIDRELKIRDQRTLTIHFGDMVKVFLTNYYNWDGQKDENGRELLQRLGTKLLRTKYPTYWAEIVAKFISATEGDWDYVIIPDLRFENEFETVSQYNDNVITVRINRFQENGKPYYNPKMRLNQLTHISECELDNFNFEYIIENHSLTELNDSAEFFVEELMKL